MRTRKKRVQKDEKSEARSETWVDWAWSYVSVIKFLSEPPKDSRRATTEFSANQTAALALFDLSVPSKQKKNTVVSTTKTIQTPPSVPVSSQSATLTPKPEQKTETTWGSFLMNTASTAAVGAVSVTSTATSVAANYVYGYFFFYRSAVSHLHTCVCINL